ncbi:MAG: NAD(P)H-dependent oxidoreductase [Eubacterium sp.]|nr:NAD(P)H-dependent oxidoreductase [Eubacterium sp.]
MVLYVNSCVREDSRTDKIARAVLDKIGGENTEVYLPEKELMPLSEERLEKRTRLIEAGDYSDGMFDLSKQFAKADKIVFSAPYWDLSFPSLLKLYIENIFVNGIVFEYDSNGVPHGLCKADEVIYVTTAGGPYIADYSFGYIKDLAVNYLGIPNATLIKAEMLDVEGFDADEIVKNTIANL